MFLECLRNHRSEICGIRAIISGINIFKAKFASELLRFVYYLMRTCRYLLACHSKRLGQPLAFAVRFVCSCICLVWAPPQQTIPPIHDDVMFYLQIYCSPSYRQHSFGRHAQKASASFELASFASGTGAFSFLEITLLLCIYELFP